MTTARLSAFSPAKINLFLHVTGRRPDGYHLLQSIFCPLTLGDQVQLEITEGEGSETTVYREGDLGHIPEHQDLTVRACRAFYEEASLPRSFDILIRVSKSTPEQAGLGGGSSNAATVLRLLQQHHGNPVSSARLADIALSLGADVPFFLQDKSAFIEGFGEKITPVSGISGHLIVYKPPLSCPTPKIFSDPQLTRNSSDVKIAVFDSARRMNGELMAYLQANTWNALQTVVSGNYPEWKHQYDAFSNCVERCNPLLIRMSGSGSAMFAVFASPSESSNAIAAVADAPELQAGHCFECQIKTE